MAIVGAHICPHFAQLSRVCTHILLASNAVEILHVTVTKQFVTDFFVVAAAVHSFYLLIRP